MLCVFDHTTQCHQKHVTYSSEVSVLLPTLGGYITASGIITLDPFPRETGFTSPDTMAGLPIPQPKAQKHTCTFIFFMMQTGAEITGSGGSVWEYTLQRWRYTGRWGGRHRTDTHIEKHTQCSINPHLGFVNMFGRQIDKQGHAHTIKHSHSKWHGQTLYCAHPQKITHSHTQLALCLQRLVVVSLWPAPLWLPPLAPTRERGLTAGPRHSLGCFCVDGAEGGGIMPFHDSERWHDAMILSGETLKSRENKRRPN